MCQDETWSGSGVLAFSCVRLRGTSLIKPKLTLKVQSRHLVISDRRGCGKVLAPILAQKPRMSEKIFFLNPETSTTPLNKRPNPPIKITWEDCNRGTKINPEVMILKIIANFAAVQRLAPKPIQAAALGPDIIPRIEPDSLTPSFDPGVQFS